MRVRFIGSGDAFGTGGRYHTCLHVIADELNMLVDCGATAAHGVSRAGLDMNAVTTILITHFHGDHFAGVPYLYLEALYRTGRAAPLLLAGPPGIEASWRAMMEALYPGLADAPRAFEMRFEEIAPGETVELPGARVSAYAMRHDPKVGICNGYRIEAEGKVFAFTGDTTWTEDIIPLGQGSDLFVSECYMRDRKIAVHLDYATLAQRLPEIGARRVVLTHMSDDILLNPQSIAHEMAEDGLTIDI